MRWLLLVLLSVAASWVVWIGIVAAAQERIIFPGAYAATSQMPVAPAGVLVPEIISDDGQAVVAWFAPGVGRSPENPGPAVIFFHGNFDRLERRWPVLARYRELGISTMAMAYRGYCGPGSGSPSQAALTADARAVRAWLAARPEVDSNRLIYHGLSLGGGVAGALAAEHPPAAMVLESTFKSLEALARAYAVPTGLCRHPFRTDEIISSLDCPILLMHGRGDTTIPLRHAQHLKRIARDATLVEGEYGHDRHQIDWATLTGFLRRYELAE